MGVETQRTQRLAEMANLGGGDAGWTHAAVFRCAGGSSGGGSGAAESGGEQGGEEPGERGGWGGMGGSAGAGGVQCTNGIVCCFLGSQLMLFSGEPCDLEV